ncbi:MAG: DUF4190 domain-containing protein [Polyangiaceae bacterium]
MRDAPPGTDVPTSSLCPEARSALALALVGLLVFGFLLGPLAVRQGLVARERIRANPWLTGLRRAEASILLGAVDVALSLAFVAWRLAREAQSP